MERVDSILGRVLARAAGNIDMADVPPCRILSFEAEGNRVFWRHSRRWLTIAEARALVPEVSDLAVRAADPLGISIYENQLLDLVRAIRAAEGFVPTPPANMARAA
ncbi:MAG: hypothetical protein VX661_12610 [Pseudomonadota bacterium]|nr:hypothetical protein [Pseudomonadota bacterium]